MWQGGGPPRSPQDEAGWVGRTALGIARETTRQGAADLWGHRCTGQARGALISLVCPVLNVKLIKEATDLINIPQIGF